MEGDRGEKVRGRLKGRGRQERKGEEGGEQGVGRRLVKRPGRGRESVKISCKKPIKNGMHLDWKGAKQKAYRYRGENKLRGVLIS